MTDMCLVASLITATIVLPQARIVGTERPASLSAISAGADLQFTGEGDIQRFQSREKSLQLASIATECCADYAVFDDRQISSRTASAGLDVNRFVLANSIFHGSVSRTYHRQWHPGRGLRNSGGVLV
jgi:hypothetical protein